VTTVRIAPSVAVATCGAHCSSCGRCFLDEAARSAHLRSDELYTECRSPHADRCLVGIEEGVCRDVEEWRRPVVWALDPRLPESAVVPDENGYPIGVRRPAA
jgi:hypothetical protein